MNYGPPQTFIQSQMLVQSHHGRWGRQFWKLANVEGCKSVTPPPPTYHHNSTSLTTARVCTRMGSSFAFMSVTAGLLRALADQMPAGERLHWSVSRTRRKVKRVSQEAINTETDRQSMRQQDWRVQRWSRWSLCIIYLCKSSDIIGLQAFSGARVWSCGSLRGLLWQPVGDISDIYFSNQLILDY